MILKETSYPVSLLIGNIGQELFRCIIILPKNGSLIFDNSQRQTVNKDVQILIAKVNTVVCRDVTEQEERTVEVSVHRFISSNQRLTSRNEQ